MSIAVRISAILLVVALVLTLVLSPFLIGTVKAGDGCVTATAYVDASRPNDGGNGLSWATAKKHIQSGINIACPGGTVYVAAGVYDQPVGDLHNIVHLDKNLTLSGAGALVTIIDAAGQNYSAVAVSSDEQINTISGFTIRNGGCSCDLSGGGIYIAWHHTVFLNDCAIINNAAYRGGGIYNHGTLHMAGCTVSGNTADVEGGGIDNIGTLDMTNCTISGNVVPGNASEDNNGGGIYNHGEAVLINVTIANNRVTYAGSRGGGFANDNTETISFKNCIVANNTAGNASNNNGYDAGSGTGINSLGYNIDSENSCYFDEPTDQRNTDPLLGPLQNNGGPTSTCTIPDNSPAFNKGTGDGAPATDQRGIARPQAGAYDIGAFELILATVISCNPDQSLAGLCPLTVVITGTNLDWVTSVNFGPGITVNSFQANGATQITANICIAGAAAPGPHDVSVTTPGNIVTKANAFTVIPLSALNSGGSGSSGTGGGGTPGNTPPVPLASIVVQSASLSTKAVTPGTPVTVTADITNKSAVNGVKKVTLYVNGQVESTQGVTVSSGSSSKLTFNVSRSEPGDYNVYVDGVPAGNFKVEMITGNDSILIFSAFLIALAFIFGLVMLWRRQRTG